MSLQPPAPSYSYEYFPRVLLCVVIGILVTGRIAYAQDQPHANGQVQPIPNPPATVPQTLPENMRWPFVILVGVIFIIGIVGDFVLLSWHPLWRMSEAISLFGITFFVTAVLFLILVSSMVKFESAIVSAICTLLASIAGYCVGKWT